MLKKQFLLLALGCILAYILVNFQGDILHNEYI
jgi:hypothetical protein